MDNITPKFEKDPKKAEMGGLVIDPGSSIEHEKADVEKYILETLLFTPQSYIKMRERAVDIKVYGPDQNQPSMKIFRMMGYCRPLPGDPENLEEVTFQDEVNVIGEKGAEVMNRWQINSSIMVDKETLKFNSIREKPKALPKELPKSLQVFQDLSTQKGAKIYAGSLRFESVGERWIPIKDGKPVATGEVPSLMPSQEMLAPSQE